MTATALIVATLGKTATVMIVIAAINGIPERSPTAVCPRDPLDRSVLGWMKR